MGLFMRTVAKDRFRSWTVILATTPAMIYLTYAMYKRVILGESPPPRPQEQILTSNPNTLNLPEKPRRTSP
ncbi:hypothetical protein DFJ77DRAFT_507711 [Powellomyces hirtus]|nr:hypothetical protein DFJ77DRAFT_507711 [Powellomyces hirtus]